MERLTHQGEHGPYWDKAVFDKHGGMEEDLIIDRLAYYEDMEEQGREEFPCKPFDTVYFIYCKTDGNHEIREGFVLRVEYSCSFKPLVTIRYNDATLDTTTHYLGLKAFMTREEAEQALSEKVYEQVQDAVDKHNREAMNKIAAFIEPPKEGAEG